MSIYPRFRGKHRMDRRANSARRVLRIGAALSTFAVMLALLPTTHASIGQPDPRIINETMTDGDIEFRDRFGSTITFGDFDSNGVSDLAIGHPFEDIGGQDGAGAVTILYDFEIINNDTTPDGINFDEGRTVRLHWDMSSMPDDAGVITSFGSALAVGDFNGDAFDDLAIGAPNDERDGESAAGSVTVFFGSATGLTPGIGNPLFFDIEVSASESVDAGQNFGWSLATGTLSEFFSDVLAVGIPGYEEGGHPNAGAVMTYTLHPGFIAPFNTYVRGGLLPPGPRTDQRVGSSVAIGIPDNELDGPSLAIGAPTLGAGNGQVYVCHRALFGDGCGNGVETLSQGTYTGSGTAAVGERFGASLVFGDVDTGNNGQELIVGSPGEAFGSLTNVGAVSIFYFASKAGQFWHQGLGAVESSNAANDAFGTSLASADLDGDDEDDVVVGVPGKDIVVNGVTRSNAGAIITLRDLDGEDLESEILVRQGDFAGNTAAGDRCGSAVATTPDFGTDDHAEVFIGCPQATINGVGEVGQVLVY